MLQAVTKHWRALLIMACTPAPACLAARHRGTTRAAAARGVAGTLLHRRRLGLRKMLPQSVCEVSYNQGRPSIGSQGWCN